MRQVSGAANCSVPASEKRIYAIPPHTSVVSNGFEDIHSRDTGSMRHARCAAPMESYLGEIVP